MKRAREAVGTPKSQAAAVAASFALPSDFAPFRMRNEYSTEETALFHCFEEHTTFQNTAGGSDQLNNNQHVEFIFQDVLRNRVSYVRNPTSAAWQYNVKFGRDNTGADQNTFLVGLGGDEYWPASHANAALSFAPHGPTYFACTDQNIAGMWVDTSAAASTITVNLNPTPASTTGTIVFYKWTNGIWTEVTTSAITATQANYTYSPAAGNSGYYALRVRNPAQAENVSVSIAGTCGCWGHFPAPYILTNGNSIESVRVLGHSILVKNFTAPLNQDGDITAVQPGKARAWTSFIGTGGTTDVFANVRDYAGAENTKPLRTGLYGFIKPTEEEDLRLREPFTIVNRTSGIASDTVWTEAGTPILNTAYAVVAMTTNTPQSQSIVVRTDTSGEFETGNQFFNIDKPRAEPQDWRDGMEALASFTQWYENPTHWKRILSTIGSIASVGGRILSLFGPKGSAVGVPMSMAGDIMRGGFQ